MYAQLLQGSKQEIAERILQMSGEIREVVVIVEEPTVIPPEPGDGVTIADAAQYPFTGPG